MACKCLSMFSLFNVCGIKLIHNEWCFKKNTLISHIWRKVRTSHVVWAMIPVQYASVGYVSALRDIQAAIHQTCLQPRMQLMEATTMAAFSFSSCFSLWEKNKTVHPWVDIKEMSAPLSCRLSCGEMSGSHDQEKLCQRPQQGGAQERWVSCRTSRRSVRGRCYKTAAVIWSCRYYP